MVSTGLSAVSAVPTGHCNLHQPQVVSAVSTSLQWSLQFPPASKGLLQFPPASSDVGSFYQPPVACLEIKSGSGLGMRLVCSSMSPLVSTVSSSLHQHPPVVSVAYTSILQWCLQFPPVSTSLSLWCSMFLDVSTTSKRSLQSPVVSAVSTSMQWCLQWPLDLS